MKRANIITVAWLVSNLALTSGCSITRKSASVDSVSRLPFFGMELAPKQREPAPETRRIRLEGSIPLEPEPAILVPSAPMKDAAWWPRKKGPDKRTAIAIPRTDLLDSPPAMEPSPPPAPGDTAAPEF